MHFVSFSSFEDDILKIIQSDKPKIIQKYLEDYLILLRNRINQYTIELTTQSLACPATLLSNTALPSLDRIDEKLNEFIRLHHLDLKRQINYHMSKLRDYIREKQILQELSSYSLTDEQVSALF